MRRFLLVALCIGCIDLMGCAKSVPVEMEWILPAPDDSGIAYALNRNGVLMDKREMRWQENP